MARRRSVPADAAVDENRVGVAGLDLNVAAAAGPEGLEAHRWPSAAALHPGTYLDTGMVRAAGIAPLGPASRGADAILAVLGASLEDGTSGQYFDEHRPARANQQAYDADVRRTLHERTLEMIRPFVPRALA